MPLNASPTAIRVDLGDSGSSVSSRTRRGMLFLLAAAQFLGMSLWFTASALAPRLQLLWGLSAQEAGWLTTVVQLGFVVGTETAAEQMRLALLRAMDLPPWTTLLARDTLGEPLAPVPAEPEAVTVALERRADLRAFDAEIRAQRIQVAAIRAERLPYLTFEGAEGWIGTGLDELFRTYYWEFRVSIPVFNGFARRYRVREQEANVKVLEARREDLRRLVVYEVDSALLELRSAAALVDAERAALRLAEEEVAEARARFSAGVAGSADVVNAALRLSDARTAVVAALAGYEAAEVALARAQGLARDLP
jgi:outer membrane protein TolC